MNAVGELAAGAALIAKSAFEELGKDIYSKIKGTIKDAIELREIKQNLYDLQNKIEDYGKVKTFWQLDRAISIKRFYCDPFLIIDKKRINIKSLSEFEIDSNILVEGIAGQGKSIFLRYLCVKELELGRFLPLFIELRQFDEEIDFNCLVKNTLFYLGFNVEAGNIYETIVSTGKVVLLLDGFDEVGTRLRKKLTKQIEDFSKKNKCVKIIASSRPNSELRTSPLFEVVRIDGVKSEEYKSYVKRLSGDLQFAEMAIKSIEKNKMGVIELLKTPLLITLLLVTYRSYKLIPSNLEEFYDSILELLLHRHDSSKIHMSPRERTSGLTDRQFRDCFDALCFFSKTIDGFQFGPNEILKISKEALRDTNVDSDPQYFIDDIVNVTCLLLKEGRFLKFIHKSVQEYYSASYISNKQDKWVEGLFSLFIKHGYRDWFEELAYLSSLKPYQYSKYFILPLMKDVLGVKGSFEEYVNQDVRRHVYDIFFNIEIEIATSESFGYARVAKAKFRSKKMRLFFNLIGEDYNKLFRNVKVDWCALWKYYILEDRKAVSSCGRLVRGDTVESLYKYRFSEIYNSGFLKDQNIDVLESACRRIIRKAFDALELIKREDHYSSKDIARNFFLSH
ncbi:hypothetical protein A7E78_03760 [Syntrophotalea acetylenivorans]|uniref:NACHT domain-containing protein n=1 Tax=Syntrophotalea acetylenivorans TaxID=1842532 RepID=A0A1L3GM62_9BACT|nr:NACHT domain-containing protein [Syntrophotalea acetylenivorans]APG27024.1 hypothetical protein A7E78_03760 [Syntrophotalea acetylenivorans]